MKIIFMGTPKFGASVLEGLIRGGYPPILAVTETDKPTGREGIITSPPVKVLAEKNGILVSQPDRIGNLKSEIENLKPDLGIVAAYGQILPKEILGIPKYGFLNVHPSLLPKYRGPSPIQSAILNGEKKTGVTIILLDEKLDHGPILAQRSLNVEEKETGNTLHDKLADLGTELLLETISKVQKGLIKPQLQDDNAATFTRILTREDGKIDWRKSAEDLEKQIRAFETWPGSFTLWEKLGKISRIKVLKARIYQSPQSENVSYPIGKVLVVPQNEIGVQCGGGFLKKGGDFLTIERLQMEGKKEMGAEEFLRGRPDFIGIILK